MTNEAKHTPGPWHIREDHGELDHDHIDGPDGVCVAVIEVGEADNEADARLIAAAPELLAALQNVLDYAERYADLNDEPQEGGCLGSIKAARAAIARASGE